MHLHACAIVIGNKFLQLSCIAIDVQLCRYVLPDGEKTVSMHDCYVCGHAVNSFN